MEEKIWDSIHYRKKEEGFDYCFEGYSSWEKIKDPTFHELRKAYLDAKKNLNDYIDEKYRNENEI